MFLRAFCSARLEEPWYIEVNFIKFYAADRLPDTSPFF